jgi:acyl transferase domain-containing protein
MKLEDIKIVDQNLMSNVTDYDDYSKLDIAIIGMAFEFPQANTAEQFWDNLVNGKSSIRSLPTNRKEDTEKYFSGFLNKAMQENKGGYLDHIDYFDYDFLILLPMRLLL